MNAAIVHEEGQVPPRPLQAGDFVHLHSGAAGTVKRASETTLLIAIGERLVWRVRGPIEGDFSNVTTAKEAVA